MAILEPALPVPTNISKEWISAAFVYALCAQAGLNIASAWEWDDGLDLTIGSAKKGYAGVAIRNTKFHLQLKSTEDWKIKEGRISFRIRVAKYNELADESWDAQHLVLYTLPRARWQWVQSPAKHAIFNHCAYFFSFAGVKPLPQPEGDDAKTTIYVPVANRLTAGELIRMYRDAEQWKRWNRR